MHKALARGRDYLHEAHVLCAGWLAHGYVLRAGARAPLEIIYVGMNFHPFSTPFLIFSTFIFICSSILSARTPARLVIFRRFAFPVMLEPERTREKVSERARAYTDVISTRYNKSFLETFFCFAHSFFFFFLENTL